MPTILKITNRRKSDKKERTDMHPAKAAKTTYHLLPVLTCPIWIPLGILGYIVGYLYGVVAELTIAGYRAS